MNRNYSYLNIVFRLTNLELYRKLQKSKVFFDFIRNKKDQFINGSCENLFINY